MKKHEKITTKTTKKQRKTTKKPRKKNGKKRKKTEISAFPQTSFLATPPLTPPFVPYNTKKGGRIFFRFLTANGFAGENIKLGNL